MTKGITPPYITFKMFLDVIDYFRNDVPYHLEKGSLTMVSDDLKGRVINVFKFLGLIGEAGAVNNTLRELVVATEENRRVIIARLLHEKYSAIMEIGLDKISSETLELEFKKYNNVSGTTCERAAQFLIQAAKFVGKEINPELEKGRRTPMTRRTTKENMESVGPLEKFDSQAKVNIREKPVDQHTLELTSGGKITLRVEIPLFELDKEDRNFVFDLIDKLREYEKGHKNE